MKHWFIFLNEAMLHSGVFKSGTQSLLNRAMDLSCCAKEVSADHIAGADTSACR